MSDAEDQGSSGESLPFIEGEVRKSVAARDVAEAPGEGLPLSPQRETGPDLASVSDQNTGEVLPLVFNGDDETNLDTVKDVNDSRQAVALGSLGEVEESSRPADVVGDATGPQTLVSQGSTDAIIANGGAEEVSRENLPILEADVGVDTSLDDVDAEVVSDNNEPLTTPDESREYMTDVRANEVTGIKRLVPREELGEQKGDSDTESVLGSTEQSLHEEESGESASEGVSEERLVHQGDPHEPVTIADKADVQTVDTKDVSQGANEMTSVDPDEVSANETPLPSDWDAVPDVGAEREEETFQNAEAVIPQEDLGQSTFWEGLMEGAGEDIPLSPQGDTGKGIPAVEKANLDGSWPHHEDSTVNMTVVDIDIPGETEPLLPQGEGEVCYSLGATRQSKRKC